MLMEAIFPIGFRCWRRTSGGISRVKEEVRTKGTTFHCGSFRDAPTFRFLDPLLHFPHHLMSSIEHEQSSPHLGEGHASMVTESGPRG